MDGPAGETMKDSGDGWSKQLQGSRMYKETSYLLKAVAQAVTQLAQKLLQTKCPLNEGWPQIQFASF